MGTKQITIEALASGTEHDIVLSPGTTAGQVLKDLGMNGKDFWLQLADPERIVETAEELFPLVEPGAKLHASPRMDVGDDR